MKRYLYFTVFVSGMTTLAVELAASEIKKLRVPVASSWNAVFARAPLLVPLGFFLVVTVQFGLYLGLFSMLLRASIERLKGRWQAEEAARKAYLIEGVKQRSADVQAPLHVSFKRGSM